MNFRTERPEEVMMSTLLPQCRPQGEIQGHRSQMREGGVPQGLALGPQRVCVSVYECVWWLVSDRSNQG